MVVVATWHSEDGRESDGGEEDGDDGDGVGGVVDALSVEFAELLGNAVDILVGSLCLLELDVDVVLDLSHGFPKLVSRLIQFISSNSTVMTKALLYLR